MSYDRNLAIAYAHRWAFARNPQFGTFDGMGGDCTNFISQCLYAGCGVMNYTPTTGWYYRGLNDRAPAWTGVNEFYRFLTNNKGPGPYGEALPLNFAQAGDVVQLSFDGQVFVHTLLIVALSGQGDEANIQIAAHTIDSDYRPLNTYQYQDMRLIHILADP